MWLVASLVAPARVLAAAPSLDATWRVAPGGAKGGAELVLTITLERGWHVNANDPDRPYLIPTTLEIDGPAAAGIESVRYPEAVVHSLGFAPGTMLRLYEGSFAIRVRVSGEVPARFGAKLGFQACNDETCLPPASLAVPFDATKAAAR